MLKTIPDVVAEVKETVMVISIEEALIKCQASQGVMIDVREPHEFEKKSARGTVNIPRGLLEMQMLQKHPDESLNIFVHCATGARAIFSAEQLQRVGYKNVFAISCALETICSVCE